MKKIISYTLLAIMFSLAIVSCNDGTEGLISKAMTAKKEESHNLLYVLGRNDEKNVLYVCTNEGIYSYSGSGIFSYVEGTGNSAKNTLYYDGTTKIYTDSNKYYKVNLADDSKEELTSLEGLSLNNLYSPDGVSFTYLFSNNEGHSVGYYTANASFDDIQPAEFDTKYSVSLIGNNAFSCEADGKYKVASISGSTVEFNSLEVTVPLTGFAKKDDVSVVTNSNNDFYYNGELKDVSPGSSIKNFVAVSNDAKYVFFPKSSYYFVSSSADRLKPSNGGLDSISVISAIQGKSDTNQYLLISTSNGAFVLDISSNTLNRIKDSNVSFSNFIY